MSDEAETTFPADKQALRGRLLEQRRSLAPQRDRGADADAIAAAAGALLDTLSMPATDTGEQARTGGDAPYDEQQCVAIYRSLPLEPPTEALAEMLLARGVRVIVPETLPDWDLQWRELWADGSEGPRLGLDGIAAAQVILAPALSVDHSGTRLGKGRGCYDRALRRRRPDAVIVAILHDHEYVGGSLPSDPHDVRVNAVITQRGGLTQIP